MCAEERDVEARERRRVAAPWPCGASARAGRLQAAELETKLPERRHACHCARPRGQATLGGRGIYGPLLAGRTALEYNPKMGSSKVRGVSAGRTYWAFLVTHPLGPFPVSTASNRWLSPPFAGACGAGWGLRRPQRPRGRTGICSLVWSRSRSVASKRPWRRLPPRGPTATAPSGSPSPPRSSARRLRPRRTL